MTDINSEMMEQLREFCALPNVAACDTLPWFIQWKDYVAECKQYGRLHYSQRSGSDITY